VAPPAALRLGHPDVRLAGVFDFSLSDEEMRDLFALECEPAGGLAGALGL
jgi:hypothetical protein